MCVLSLIPLLGIRIPEVHELKGIPERESKEINRMRICSLLIIVGSAVGKCMARAWQ